MKKFVSIVLAAVMLLIMCSCQKADVVLPRKDLPDYPLQSTHREGEYTVSGKVVDMNNNGLKNARITVNGDVMALTEEDGSFSIKSLYGTNKIGVIFSDYIFRRTEYTVNNTSDDLIFEGSADFAASASAVTVNGAQLFGVMYTFGDQRKSENLQGIAYALNNKGKTIITPYKEGFTFYPSSATVYNASHTTFTAVPNDDTYTVSGVLNFPTSGELPTVFLYVNGIKYTQSVISVSANDRKATYQIFGLKNDGTQYVVWAGSGMENFKSKDSLLISSERTDANFEMIKCANLTINLVFEPSEAPTSSYSYYITIKDEKGLEVEKHKVSNRLSDDNYDVWAGCTIIVESEDFYGSEKISENFLDYKNTEIDIKIRKTR